MSSPNEKEVPDFKAQVRDDPNHRPSNAQRGAHRISGPEAGRSPVQENNIKDVGPDFKAQVRDGPPPPHTATPGQPQRGARLMVAAVITQQSNSPDHGPRFKNQVYEVVRRPPEDEQQDPAAMLVEEPEGAVPDEGGANQSGDDANNLPLEAHVVNDSDVEEQIRNRILKEAAQAEVVGTPSQLMQPRRQQTSKCWPCKTISLGNAVLLLVVVLAVIITVVVLLKNDKTTPAPVTPGPPTDGPNPVSPPSSTSSPSPPSPTPSSQFFKLMPNTFRVDVPSPVLVASLSSDGTTMAFAVNGTVQVYQQRDDDDETDGDWFLTGDSIPGETLRYFDTRSISVSLASDAMVLAVGRPLYDSGAGQVDVYTSDEGKEAWILRGGAPLTGSSTSTDDGFGYDVQLSSDGSVLAVAASNYDNDSNGYAQILQWNNTLETWNVLHEVEGLSSASDLSISMSEPIVRDGVLEIVLALGDPNDGIVGIVEAYDCRTDESGCVQRGPTLNGPDYEDLFGSEVALSLNGDFLAVGSPGIIQCQEGCANVQVMEFGKFTEDVWTNVGQRLGGNVGMGRTVRISQSGDILTVGFVGDNYFWHYYGDDEVESCDDETNWECVSRQAWTQVYQFSDNGVWVELDSRIQGRLLDFTTDGCSIAVESSNGVIMFYQCDTK